MRAIKTTGELLDEMKGIEDDPASKVGAGGFYIYNAKARKKLDRIREEITHNMVMKKKAEGTYAAPDGYSGCKQNRRR
jgi:hypothetical protein